MSTIDLMLLGVLMDKPMNAYEMKKEMELRDIKDWIKISSPSVYKNLIKLYKNGYIDGKIIHESEMPEKTVYTINDKGRKYFMKLMQKYSEEPEKIYIDFSSFISNLSHVDKESGLKMLENLKENLQLKCCAVNEQLDRMGKVSFYASEVIKLYSQVYSVFCNWTEDFIKQYKEHN